MRGLILALVLLPASGCGSIAEYEQELAQIKIEKAHGDVAVKVVTEWWEALPADAEGRTSLRDIVYGLPALGSSIYSAVRTIAEASEQPET